MTVVMDTNETCNKCGASPAFKIYKTHPCCGVCCKPLKIGLLNIKDVDITAEQFQRLQSAVIDRLTEFGFISTTVTFDHVQDTKSLYIIRGKHTVPKVNAKIADSRRTEHLFVFTYKYGEMTVTPARNVLSGVNYATKWQYVIASILHAMGDPSTGYRLNFAPWRSPDAECHPEIIRKDKDAALADIRELWATLDHYTVEVEFRQKELAEMIAMVQKTRERLDESITTFKEKYREEPMVNYPPLTQGACERLSGTKQFD